MSMELHDFNEARLTDQIEHLISQAPHCLKNAPVILALDKYDPSISSFEINTLCRLCRKYGICLFAFRGGNKKIKLAAVQAGLIPLPDEKSIKNENNNTTTNELKATESLKNSKDGFFNEISDAKKLQNLNSASSNHRDQAQQYSSHSVNNDSESKEKHNRKPIPGKIVTEPVRSGQQIYHPGELIVLAPVSAGAELVSDSNIHVYNTLRGKALAGVNGNDHARIFCSCFESELISINGHYKTASDILPEQTGCSVQVWFHNGCLNITPLPER